MKRLKTTDTHVGYKNNDYWNKVSLNFFKHICQYAKENNIRELVHLGDFFDDRKNFNIKHVLNFTNEYLIPLLKDAFERIYIIVGNHDAYLKDGIEINSLSIFKYIPNFIIITEPYELDDMKLFPWGYIPTENDKDFICRGHWEINGPVINASGQCATGFKNSLSDFKNIKKVESGHFHTPGEYGNIQYLGAPYHMNHNDRGERGFYVIDGDEQEFIAYNDGPEFMDIFVSVIDDIEISKIVNIDDYIMVARHDDENFKPISDLENMNIKDNHIRLVYLKELGSNLTNEMNERIHSFGPETVKVKFSFSDEDVENDDEENIISVSDDEKELLIRYIDSKPVPDHINKMVLKGLVEQLVSNE